MARISTTIGATFVAAGVVLYAAGRVDLPTVVWGAAFAAFLSLATFWRFRGSPKGEVKVDNNGITLHARQIELVLPRECIVRAATTCFSQRGAWDQVMAVMMGVPLERGFVEIRLTRSIRSFGRRRAGPSAFGIPLPGTKRIDLHVQDADGLVEAARSLLGIG